MEPTETTQDKDRTRYVEELEGQDDYWLSITDAARVCRVQDVSIRRAIASGRLPVRKQGAGDNKRTRFVRASDLPRANFPILDSGAAITSDIRKVDVLNLPLQIQRLTEQTAQIQEKQAAELAQIREQLGAIQGTQRDQRVAAQEQLEQIQGEFTVALRQQQEEFSQRLTTFDERIGDIASLAMAQAQQYHALKDELQAQVQRVQEQAEKRLQEQMQQTEERLHQFQTALAALREEFEAIRAIETKKIDALTRMAEQERQQRENFERIMTRVATNADAAASEARATVATLGSQLEAERTARLALEERLNRLEAAQQESVKVSEAQPSTPKSPRRRKATE